MKALVYRGSRGFLRRTQWRARIVSNGKIIFISSEGYNNKDDLIEQLKALNVEIEVQP